MQKTFPGHIGALVLGLALLAMAGMPAAAGQSGGHLPHAADPSGAEALSRPPAPDYPARPAASSRPFDSGLTGYRRYDPDEPLLDWRAINDEVGRLGGHVGQLAPQDGERQLTVPSHAHH